MRLRSWLLALGVGLSACGLQTTSAPPAVTAPPVQSPTATPMPEITLAPSPTPTQFAPGADGVATAYLKAWEDGDFVGMYSLLSRTSQSLLDQETYSERYLSAQKAATVLEVKTRPLSILQHEGESTAEAAFELEWRTALLGEIRREMTMPLVFEGGRWAVSWSDALILPELGGGNSLQLEYHIPARAGIYDRNGLGLAVEGTAVTLGVVPGSIEEEEQDTLLALLSQMTGMAAEEIHALYASADPNWYVPLTDVPQDAVAPLLDSLRPFIQAGGLQLRERKTRLYRDGGVAPHVVGYIGGMPAEQLDEWLARGYRGDERVGVAGLESWGESYLGGGRGGTLYLLSPAGDVLSTLLEVPAQANRSIYATLDKPFQMGVEQILASAIQTHPDGHAGAVVVMDVASGQILAMASYPDYDPNLFDPINPNAESGLRAILNSPGQPLVNRATQGVYPPGSVFKIVSMSAALISGAYLPDTGYTCTGTWDGLGPYFVKKDWLEGGHGYISLRQALTFSCDPYFYEVGLTLDRVDTFLLPETARAYGFGAPTGVLGLLEDGGTIPDPEWKLTTQGEGWAPGDSVNMAIGQGFVAATPLQVTSMLAAVANGGTLYRPLLVHRLGEGDDVAEEIIDPEIVGQLPVSAEQLAVIQESLHAVTTETGGTAVHRFRYLAIPVAGKTGTAEVAPTYRDDGSLNEEPTAWFAGYAPAAATPGWDQVPDEPEIAITVMIEHAGEGSAVAAPIFRQIVELYYGIQPLTPFPWLLNP